MIAIKWLASTAMVLLSASSFATEEWKVTDIGTLGGNWTKGSVVNNIGQVAGISTRIDGSFAPFIWSKASGIADLGISDWASGVISGINDSGQIVGHYRNLSGSESAFFWDPIAGMKLIGTFKPTDINNHGQVVGNSDRPILWTMSGGISELAESGNVASINDSGVAAGTQEFSTLGGSFTSGMLWNTNNRTIRPFHDAPITHWRDSVTDISNGGIAVGWEYDSSLGRSGSRGFLFDGAVKTLPFNQFLGERRPNSQFSRIERINDRGDMLGSDWWGPSDYFFIIDGIGVGFINLPIPGCRISDMIRPLACKTAVPIDIANDESVLIHADTIDGYNHSFLLEPTDHGSFFKIEQLSNLVWNPIPEPSSYALIACGLLVVGFSARLQLRTRNPMPSV